MLLFSPLRIAAAQTQPGSLHGTVKATTPDKQLFQVEGARLELDGSAANLPSYSAFSNQDGAFSFAAVQPGTYKLKVTGEGFKPFEKSVSIEAGKAAGENLVVEFAAVRQEVNVREQAPKVSQESTAPPATLSAPKLKSVPTTESKFKEALPFVPSVVRTQDEKIHIKGTAENQGMLLTDMMESVDPVTGAFVIDVPLDAIDSLEVFKAPYRTEYGGFSGGMTSIHTKAPSSQWKWSMHDVNPSIRGRQGHMVGFAKAEPRLYFSGPVTKKLTFSEAFMYQMRKEPIRGLAWPKNEVKTQGFNSFTDLQYLFSPTHLAILHVNIFPKREQFANINALVPQSASSDDNLKGYSVGATDSYQFASGGLLASQFRVTRMTTNAHGQGSADMLVTPLGWGGNYFNAWNRDTNQEEGLETYEFPTKEKLGKHRVKVGVDYIHRSFDGFNHSQPVQILRTDGSVAESIDFAGAGTLHASDTQVSGFVQDHWALTDNLALDLGARYFGQSIGESANLEPRLGFVYSPDSQGKTIFRGGMGFFDDRVTLLAADFAENPMRIVSTFDDQGNPLAPPVQYANVCAKKSGMGMQILPSCSELGSNPHNLTWNIEADRHIGRNLLVRIGYLSSHTFNTFVVDPVDPFGTNPMLMLSNRGSSRYHEYEASVRFRTGERSDITVSYVHSRSRGDLNNLGDIYVPFEQPVIRPNLYGNLPSDLPERLTALGTFKLPMDFTLVPAFDLHSGFPYSNVDQFQEYVGGPNSQRFPIYFSIDWRVYRDFPLPFGIHKGHKFRLGVYSINTTGRRNPHDVYNNITSPLFGNFAGLGKRINGLVIGFAE